MNFDIENSLISESPEVKDVDSQMSTDRPHGVRISQPEFEPQYEPNYEPQYSVRLPVIRRDTQVHSLMNHDIYIKNGERKSMNSHNSVPDLTFRNNGSSFSKNSKHSSLQSQTKSNASIFKERYDKNIENYMSKLESKYYNRKNYSSNISKLMSPNFSASKSKHLEL